MMKITRLHDNDFGLMAKCHIIFTADKAQSDIVSF